MAYVCVCVSVDMCITNTWFGVSLFASHCSVLHNGQSRVEESVAHAASLGARQAE